MNFLKLAYVSFRNADIAEPYIDDSSDVQPDEYVLVEGSKGPAFAKVIDTQVVLESSCSKKTTKKVLRVATDRDHAQVKRNDEKSRSAEDYCLQCIKKFKLDMKLLRVEYSFSGSSAVFFFSARGRVDFREIVKDLASHLRIRIEMKQVGVRDELKLIGSIGICGRETCCSSFLPRFSPISIKMAKNQNLPLNPSKVSGSCGRLLCCLEYENETYLKLRKGLPGVGKRVKLENYDDNVRVLDIDLFANTCRIETKAKDVETLDLNVLRSFKAAAKDPRQEPRRKKKKSPDEGKSNTRKARPKPENP